MPTTPYGVPYPADTDLVKQGAANIQAVAEQLDTRVLAGLNWGTAAMGAAGDTKLRRSAAGIVSVEGATAAAGRLTAARLAGRAGPDLTVAANAVTVTNTFHRITTNAGAAALGAINGGGDGDILFLLNWTGSTFTLDMSGANIRGASANTPFSNSATKLLVFNGVSSIWMHIGG